YYLYCIFVQIHVLNGKEKIKVEEVLFLKDQKTLTAYPLSQSGDWKFFDAFGFGLAVCLHFLSIQLGSRSKYAHPTWRPQCGNKKLAQQIRSWRKSFFYIQGLRNCSF